MKKTLLIFLILSGCQQISTEIAKELAGQIIEKRCQKYCKTPTPRPTSEATLPPQPTILPTATPTIGEPPSEYNTCAKVKPVSCSTAQFGDGRGGTLFKRSETNPNNYAFLLPGNIETLKNVEVCADNKCIELPFTGCANADHIGLRPHYKGPVPLDRRKAWAVKFDKCSLRIKDKERTD